MNDFLEIDRMTLYEYELRMKAFRLKRVDAERYIHLQAWAIQQVKATRGKSGKPYFRKFKDFFDFKKAEKQALETGGAPKSESLFSKLVARANQ